MNIIELALCVGLGVLIGELIAAKIENYFRDRLIAKKKIENAKRPAREPEKFPIIIKMETEGFGEVEARLTKMSEQADKIAQTLGVEKVTKEGEK